jgi:hypothetical protein
MTNTRSSKKDSSQCSSNSILTSSIDKKEFNCIDGLDVAKDIWTTLWMAHEGSNPV